jgi:hypothetical protein
VWQRDSLFLDEVKGLSPFRLLEASSHDPVELEQAIQAWAGIDQEVKAYLNARLAYNVLIGVDELRRRLDRGNNHLSSIRTGTRLTAERLETLNEAQEEGFGSLNPLDDEDLLFDEGSLGGMEMAPDSDEDFTDDDEAELAEAFMGLDESPGGVFVAQEPEPQVQAQAPTQAAERKASPRKRKAAKKASGRKSSDKDNGVGTSVEVLDENGHPMQPSA